MGLHPPARSLTEITQQLALDRLGPAAALVDRQYRVLVLCGPADRFLKVPSGEIDAELLGMVREGLRAKVRSALHQAAKDGGEVVQTGRVKRNGDYYQVQIVVTPVNVPDFQEGLFLVLFQGGTEVQEPAPEPAGPTSTEEQYVRQVERELQDTRLELNSTIEQLEGSNEELKASHEEAVSMNEELQSSNEELETSKEELQSLNEELTTLNNQLEEKVSQLEATTNDLDNLLTSTDIATLFLDTDLPHPAVHARGRRVVPPDSRRTWAARSSTLRPSSAWPTCWPTARTCWRSWCRKTSRCRRRTGGGSCGGRFPTAPATTASRAWWSPSTTSRN